MTKSRSEQTDPPSVEEYFKGKFREAIKKLPSKYWDKTEFELNQMGRFTPIDVLIRKNFWEVVDHAQVTARKSIKTIEIYEGICTHQCFYEIIRSELKLAWILNRPIANDLLLDEILSLGLQKLRNELLTLPVNEKTVPIFLRGVEFLANRVLGPVAQKVEAKSAHIDLSEKRKSTKNSISNDYLNAENVLERYKNLREKIGPLLLNEFPLLWKNTKEES